jgi:hypothetical protein
LKKKKPKQQAHPLVAKIPHSIESPVNKKNPTFDPAYSPASTKQKMPVWRIGMIDFGGYWGWENLNNVDSLKSIQDKLRHFEKMTWGEIEKKLIGKGTQQNHFMPVNKICKDARNRLKEINLDDQDYLYSLRFSGTERLWGIREAEILYILWWDHDHSVYPI